MMPPLDLLASRSRRSCLLGVLAQQVWRSSEDAKQLPVEVLAVGDHHQCWVLKAWVDEQRPRQTGHLDALARALGVPDHTALSVTTWFACFCQPLDCCPDGMELVVSGDLLGDPAAVLLEQAEGASEVEQSLLIKETSDQGFEFTELAEWIQVLLGIDHPPLLEAFP